MNKSKSISKVKKNDLTLSDTEQNTILGTIYDGGLAIDVAKDLKISLRTFYRYLETNPKFKAEFNKAQEVGIKTLVEKMLQIFQHQEVENPNQILWIREKTKFIQYLAGHLTDLYSNNKVQNIKSDTSLKVSWEEPSELIDVSTAETVPTPPKD